MKIYIDNKCIASHIRNREPVEHTQVREHLAPNIQAYVSRSPEYYCAKAREEQSPELEIFIQSLFMNRKRGVTDAICYNICDFLFSLKKKNSRGVFPSGVENMCLQSHLLERRYPHHVQVDAAPKRRTGTIRE